MGNVIDLIGQRFGRLTVIERAENNKNSQAKWKCVCDCGNEVVVFACNLKSGATKSCGCFNSECITKRNTKHNMACSRLFNVWSMMRKRCIYPKDKRYHDYGGRGITVCDEWQHFEAFYKWATENGYSDGLTLDRIDNNGNYEPSNCRFATFSQQANNRRSNHLLTFNGKTLTMKQWSDELGITYSTIEHRIKRGWSVEKTLTTPMRKKGA